MSAAHRLPRWQRLGLYGSGALLLLSGSAWLVLHYAVGDGELPLPAEAWCLKAHGLASFAALFVLGALAADHVPRGWRLSHRHRWLQQRLTGIVLCVSAALAVLSAYLLYYFAPESLRPSLGWMHAAFGATACVVVAMHRRGA